MGSGVGLRRKEGHAMNQEGTKNHQGRGRTIHVSLEPQICLDAFELYQECGSQSSFESACPDCRKEGGNGPCDSLSRWLF